MTHYFINDNNLKSQLKKITMMINDKSYTIYTDNGVFSKNSLDYGTKILLENLPVDKINGKVLDLGCGYGIVGIYLALNTDAIIHMTDINLRALHLAKLNAKEYHLGNVNIYESNIYDNISEKFSFIITNPPIRAGKKTVYDMILKAINYLEKDGELWIVIRKDKGAETLLKDMEKNYIAKIAEKNNGFFVISAKIR